MLGSCRELGDIDISMIHGRNGVLVQNYCIVLKSLFFLACGDSAITEGSLAPTGQKPSWDPSVLLNSDEVQSLEPWRCWFTDDTNGLETL